MTMKIGITHIEPWAVVEDKPMHLVNIFSTSKDKYIVYAYTIHFYINERDSYITHIPVILHHTIDMVQYVIKD